MRLVTLIATQDPCSWYNLYTFKYEPILIKKAWPADRHKPDQMDNTFDGLQDDELLSEVGRKPDQMGSMYSPKRRHDDTFDGLLDDEPLSEVGSDDHVLNEPLRKKMCSGLHEEDKLFDVEESLDEFFNVLKADDLASQPAYQHSEDITCDDAPSETLPDDWHTAPGNCTPSDADMVAAEAAVPAAAPADAPALRLEEWARGVVEGLEKDVTPRDEAAWCAYVENVYGSRVGWAGPKEAQVRKLILIDRLLLVLVRFGVVQVVLLLDEDAPESVRCMLRPEREWSVLPACCPAFNKAFRALQANHQSWPRNREKIVGTKGITQPLSALGMSSPEGEGRWKSRTSGLRGPEKMDPQKVWDEGKNQYVTVRSKRDGLYFTRYVYSEKRARENAYHVFHAKASGVGVR